MKKNKNRNKIDPGMMFYAQKKCSNCGKLIVGRSPKSYRAANSDLGQRLKVHRDQHEKEGKQLNLSIPGSEQKQSQTISRVSLRGEEKSA